MSIPRHYVDEAIVTMTQIDTWFSAAVQANPGNAITLVAERAAKINGEIYEHFTNTRFVDYQTERDVNSLRLNCRAGRGSPFGGVPTDSSSGSVRRDSEDWTYDSHRVHVHSSLEGSDDVDILDGNTGCSFKVKCTGVAFEDTQRGSGWHRATLHVTFRMTDGAIGIEVQTERIALQRELGL